jgi:hypothetical protein
MQLQSAGTGSGVNQVTFPTGNVGIGTTPSEKLHVTGNAKVSGQVVVGAQSLAAGGAIDFNSGAMVKFTAQPTNNPAALTNMQVGGTYIISAPMGASPISWSFTDASGECTNGTGWKWLPAQATAVANKDSLYTIVKVGTTGAGNATCYVSWTSGY